MAYNNDGSSDYTRLELPKLKAAISMLMALLLCLVSTIRVS
jgi:hypothetical protein